MRVVNYSPDNYINLPVDGNGSDIKIGALLMRGATGGTNTGRLILAASAGADCIGVLQEKHTYSATGDTNQGGTVFVTHPIDLIVPARMVRVEYSQGSSDLITCTQTVTTTTMTVTSLEDDIDGAFLYVVSGLGAGQTNFLTASTGGACTLKAAFGTSLDTTSKFIKILPRFHKLAVLTSDGTKLSSTAAVGTWTVAILDNYIVRDNAENQLNPVKHDTLTGLNGYSSLRFEALVAVRKNFYTID